MTQLPTSLHDPEDSRERLRFPGCVLEADALGPGHCGYYAVTTVVCAALVWEVWAGSNWDFLEASSESLQEASSESLQIRV